jgi:hypothetical protein
MRLVKVKKGRALYRRDRHRHLEIIWLLAICPQRVAVTIVTPHVVIDIRVL